MEGRALGSLTPVLGGGAALCVLVLGSSMVVVVAL